MARLEPQVPLYRSAIAVASLMIFVGAVSGCGWRSASSEKRDDGKLRATALENWTAGIEARRARAAELDEAAAAARTKPSQPLIEAAQFGDVKLVESLLVHGADRKTLNEALLVAARSEPLVLGAKGQKDIDLSYAAVAKLLLKKGANIEARDEYSTPLISAAGNGETASVSLLLEKGADIEAIGADGQTALIAAACMCPSVDMPETDDSVRLLLDKGANIEAKDKQGGTALLAAAGWGRASILEILLDRGANIEAADNEGNTALLISAKGSALPTADAVQVLLVKGADIEARNNNGESALMLAASNGGFEDVKIVKMLLNRGADVRAKDNRGRTALNIAAGKGRTEIVSLLRAATAKSR